ncbi:hypothetical protein ACIGW8_33920 [Streptomyces sioyaensis]|uniref:hypothetical protein n=1 Tax=Streptomyces sioyaensis TaxID=67364 RepID=UPI0037D35BC0
MRMLVLGDTSFVGRAIVEDALRTGAEVALFGRGKTGVETEWVRGHARLQRTSMVDLNWELSAVGWAASRPP